MNLPDNDVGRILDATCSNQAKFQTSSDIYFNLFSCKWGSGYAIEQIKVLLTKFTQNNTSNATAMPILYLLNVGSLKHQQIHVTDSDEEVPHVLEVLNRGLRGPIGGLHRVNGVLNDLPKQQQSPRSYT